MLVLVGIKVSQFGGIARKMTWFQVSVCHSLQFPWHFVCETWCQRFVAGGVRATRRDLKLRRKMFCECVGCGYVNLCRCVYVYRSIGMLLKKPSPSHCSIQTSRPRTQRGVLLSCSFFAPCQADSFMPLERENPTAWRKNVAGQESRNSTLSCCLPNFVLAWCKWMQMASPTFKDFQDNIFVLRSFQLRWLFICMEIHPAVWKLAI